MEPKYYIVSRIDGDYAWLSCTSAQEEPYLSPGRCCRRRLTKAAA